MMRKHIVYEVLDPNKGNIRYLSQLTLLSRKNRKTPTEAEQKI